MSATALLSLLSGTSRAGFATALTWVEHDALLGVTGLPAEKDALAAFAASLGADGVLVDGSAAWAAEAVSVVHGRGLACVWAVDGILSRIARSSGWPAALRISAEAVAWAAAVDDAASAGLSDVEIAMASGADVLIVADDLAGPEWLVAPQAAEVAVRGDGLLADRWGGVGPAIFHSDGRISTLMPSVAAAGFSAVHFGRLGDEDLAAAFRSAWQSGLCPVGGIDAESSSSDRLALLADLCEEGPCVIADDGGTCSKEQAVALTHAFGSILALLGET